MFVELNNNNEKFLYIITLFLIDYIKGLVPAAKVVELDTHYLPTPGFETY